MVLKKTKITARAGSHPFDLATREDRVAHGVSCVRSWQMGGRLVKVAWLAIFGIAIVMMPAVGATQTSTDALLEFWRTVFERPEETAVQDNVRLKSALAVVLGRQLFGDTRLSGAGNRACSSCHNRELGFSDGLKRGRGSDGIFLKRNTPTLFNVGWGTSFNWDGSASSLEQQALGPILRPNELGGDFTQIVGRLSADADSRQQFAAAFPDNPIVSKENILAALAAFERSIVSPRTRFDGWITGEQTALTLEELSGFKIFVGKGGCVGCHAGWRFSDDLFHDTGLAVPSDSASDKDAGKKGVFSFKTPTLRMVRETGPYMHDGSLSSLESVVEHYSTGVTIRKGLSAVLKRRIELSPEEKAQLIAFLKTL